MDCGPDLRELGPEPAGDGGVAQEVAEGDGAGHGDAGVGSSRGARARVMEAKADDDDGGEDGGDDGDYSAFSQFLF